MYVYGKFHSSEMDLRKSVRRIMLVVIMISRKSLFCANSLSAATSANVIPPTKATIIAFRIRLSGFVAVGFVQYSGIDSPKIRLSFTSSHPSEIVISIKRHIIGTYALENT